MNGKKELLSFCYLDLLELLNSLFRKFTSDFTKRPETFEKKTFSVRFLVQIERVKSSYMNLKREFSSINEYTDLNSSTFTFTFFHL